MGRKGSVSLPRMTESSLSFFFFPEWLKKKNLCKLAPWQLGKLRLHFILGFVTRTWRHTAILYRNRSNHNEGQFNTDMFNITNPKPGCGIGGSKIHQPWLAACFCKSVCVSTQTVSSNWREKDMPENGFSRLCVSVIVRSARLTLAYSFN